jgi:tight adherence protein C
MEQVLAFLITNGNLVVYAAIFLSVAFVTFAIANLTASWSDVRRRAVSMASDLPSGGSAKSEISLTGRQSNFLKGLLPTDEAKKTELVKFLNSAGYYGNAAVVRFQLIRILTAIGLGMATAVLYGRIYPDHPFFMAAGVSVIMTFLGYILPRSIVSMKRDKLFEEHRQGFPDFLDLLVICVEAGIGVDSAVERVSVDLARNYPSLGRNLGFMSLELRAGKSTREALENLGSRLGIPEARSFATLIQQSEELGTSLVQSLRVYSDEMRSKRLARAEEKAHSLPVKLVLPLALFIFPVILGVTLMPVAMKLFEALGKVGP